MADMTVEQMAMRANQVTDEVETQEPPPPPTCLLSLKQLFPAVYSGFIDFIDLLIDKVKTGAFCLSRVANPGSLNPFKCLVAILGSV